MLRVATFNIRNGRAFDGLNSWPFRRRSTAAAIDSLGADVVGLQEVFAWQQRSLLHRLPGFTAVGAGRNDGHRGEHSSVLVATDRVRIIDSDTRWYGPEPDRPGTRLSGARFPRIATIVRLEMPSGSLLQLACTHLDAQTAVYRQTAVEQLVTWLDPALPRVVLGDFNADPGDAELAPMAAAGYREALPADAGGTNHDFTGQTNGRRLDHIFVSEDIEVIAASVEHPRPGGRLPSDHWPVVADLRW